MAETNYTGIGSVRKHTCVHCGEQYTPKQRNSIYCSKRCKRLEWQGKNQDKVIAYKVAAAAIQKAKLLPYSTVSFCICATCSKPFTARSSRAQYCGKQCRPSEYKTKIDSNCSSSVCTVCGKQFNAKYSGGRRSYFCSEHCKDLRQLANKRISRLKRKVAVKCATVELVDPYKVFDRDKWHCKLCGAKTPKLRRGTYEDDAPELDHIIPISKGGEHSYRNTQCTCRRCNGLKSDRPMGQLLLIG